MAKPSNIKLRNLKTRMLRKIAALGVVKARRFIPSRTLRRSINVKLFKTRPQRGASLFIPHYWALYVHDGRRGISKVGTRRFLVFFSNPAFDPRTNGGKNFPVRASQIKKLTKAQFDEGMRINKRLELQGLPPFSHMKVLKKVGPARGTPFFEMVNTVSPSLQFQAQRPIREMFSAFMHAEVIVNEKKTAKVKMPRFRRLR